MAKLTAWLVTLIGVVWLLPLLNVNVLAVNVLAGYSDWIIGLSFLVIGIGKLMRNYSKKKRR